MLPSCLEGTTHLAQQRVLALVLLRLERRNLELERGDLRG